MTPPERPRRPSLDDLVGQFTEEAPEPAPAARPPAAAPGRDLARQPADAVDAAGRRVAVMPAGQLPEIFLRRADLDARSAVLAACDSARRTPKAWQAYSLRFPPDLASRLVIRLATDKDQNPGIPLAASHYVEAALDALPFGDLEAVAAVGREWQAARSLRAAPGKAPSPGTLLHGDTASAMRRLTTWLKTLEDSVRVQDVGAGALTRLLDELDANPITGSV